MTNSQLYLFPVSTPDNASYTGTGFWVGKIINASFIPIFGDTSTSGTVKIQGSNELPVGSPNQYVPTSASFADIPSATSTVSSGVGSAIVLGQMPFAYIRAVYTSSSPGSGTISVNMNQQGI